ncbi:MAG: hypothetical protein ACTHNY_02935 [Solirubrobacterales bacterium]
MALAAFAAFAVAPSVASATNDPDVTHPTGTLLAVSHAAPAAITATNVGETLMTDINGNVLTRCNKAVMTGDLETNTGSGTVEATITSATFAGSGSLASNGELECTGSFGNITVTANPATNGLPWCLRSTSTMVTDEFQIRGNGCTSASRPIRFVLDSTTAGECAYERSGAIPGTFTTHPASASAAQLSISKVEFPRISGGFLCPSAGFLDMTFELETSSGSAIYIS